MNDKPWCQIYDLDGTLAIKSDRGHYDWDRVDEDTENENISHLIWMNSWARDRGYGDSVIIVSGRSDICRDKTHKWLQDSAMYHSALYMRKNGDYRDDTVVKEEIFNEYIKDKYNVRFVVDDRPKVCRMWRSLGLTVLHVGDPHVEF